LVSSTEENRELCRNRIKFSDNINPYPANVENTEFLIMPVNGRWDLIRRLKG